MLKLADNLKLPLDVVTQTIAILAKRRAGKSYTMRRLVEQLVHARQQVVLVDPKGDQWGIRSAADGKAAGLPLVILGGERGDVRLEVGAGEVVAKLMVEERVSAVLDLSLLRKKEVAVFMMDFLETLYRLKAREVYRTPMMLVVDEADAIAPQKPMPGEERMLGAIEDIVRRGGQRGIGCTVVSQRSAVLNKNVLTQAQILVALRTIAPQDLKAMKEWIDVHGEEAERKVLMDSLPALPVGDAWFWSPGWPTTAGIFVRAHILPIETFDSGATPAPGQKRREPKTVADVDLGALQRQMAETIERAKADDPRELRRRIQELEKQLRTQPTPAAAAPAKEERVEVPVIKDAQIARLEKVAERFEGLATTLAAARSEVTAALNAARGAVHAAGLRAAGDVPRGPGGPIRGQQTHGRQAAHDRGDVGLRRREHVAGVASPNGTLKAMHRAMLTVLAQADDAGKGVLSKRQIRVRTGYRDSGPVSSAFADLVRDGWATAVSKGELEITPVGRGVLGHYEQLPLGAELRQALLDGRVGKLTTMERKFLAQLCEVHPQALTKAELRDGAGYADSGPVSSAFAHLVALDYAVEAGRGALKASDELFEEA